MIILLEATPMIINRLELKGLHGIYNYSVAFREDLTFIYGENGCGKTTILDIVSSIVTGRLYNLFRYKFDELTLSYRENKRERLNRIRIKSLGNSIELFLNENQMHEIIDAPRKIGEVYSRDEDDYTFDRRFMASYEFPRFLRRTFNYIYLPLSRNSQDGIDIIDMPYRRHRALTFPDKDFANNIESYYCTKDSAIKYMRGILRKTREQTEAIIDFDTWFRTFQEEFGKLFALFALVQHYCPVIPNVGDVMRFLDTDGSLISDEYLQYEKQVAEHIDSIDAQIQKVFEKTQYQITNSDKGTSNFSTIICGKCQLESFCRHLKICSGKNINRENIRNSFIMTFDLEPLQFIRDRVLYLLAHGAKAQNSA